MARNSSTSETSFDEQLVLFQFFLRQVGIDSLPDLGKKLNSVEYEGFDESGNTYFMSYLAQINRHRGVGLSADKLRQYDENICRHTRKSPRDCARFR